MPPSNPCAAPNFSPDRRPCLIAGPTASGKSALALALAQRQPSIIINADSMQVYDGLRIVTAAPSKADEAAHPHALFGCIDPSVAYSTGDYVRDVARVLEDARTRSLRPIIVGGTGLYFKALLDGLSPVPPISGAIRSHWRAEAERLGSPALHAVLAARDPVMAARLRPSDPQRVTRALEVLEATGRSLADWQAEPGVPVLEAAACDRLVVTLDRETLLVRADARFDAMIEAGALAEAEAMAARGLDPRLPAMRALGVPELIGHVRGERSLEDAVAGAKLATRQYIKRQLTWIKRHMISWSIVVSQ